MNKIIYCFLFIFLSFQSFYTFAEEQPIILLSKEDIQITQTDLLLFLQQGDKNKQISNLKRPKKINQIIQYLYLNKKLAKEALKLGLDKEPTIAYQLNQARETILKSARLMAFKPKKMPEFEDIAKIKYLTHQKKYQVEEKVQVAHIMVNFVNRTDKEALARIKEAQTALSKGESFKILAKKYSDDLTNNEKGGILIPYARKDLLKSFSDAAFNLKQENELSEIIKTRQGYHLIKLIKKMPAHIQSFRDVKETIISRIKIKYIADQKSEFIKTKKTKIETYPIHEKNLSHFIQQRLDFLEK